MSDGVATKVWVGDKIVVKVGLLVRVTRLLSVWDPEKEAVCGAVRLLSVTEAVTDTENLPLVTLSVSLCETSLENEPVVLAVESDVRLCDLDCDSDAEPDDDPDTHAENVEVPDLAGMESVGDMLC